MLENEIMRSLGRIEGKLEEMQKEQVRVATYTAETSKRVGAVEQKLARVFGYAAGAGLVGGFLFTVVTWFLKKEGLVP